MLVVSVHMCPPRHGDLQLGIADGLRAWTSPIRTTLTESGSLGQKDHGIFRGAPEPPIRDGSYPKARYATLGWVFPIGNGDCFTAAGLARV